MHKSRNSQSTTDAMSPKSPSLSLPQRAVIIAGVWAVGIGAVIAVRFRAQWDIYAAMHSWCASKDIPDFVRNLDSLILFVAAAFLGALIATLWCAGRVTQLLCLTRGRRGCITMVLISLVPMVGGGLVLAGMRWSGEATLAEFFPRFVGGVVRAPIAEEMLFRGLLVGVCAAAIGWRGPRFWINASIASILFAATHVAWVPQAFVDGWTTLVVTGGGGLWYAWLLSRWKSLWVVMTLHAGMNLGWLLADATGGAGGGGWADNILRASTIAIATWWTISITKGNNQD